MSEYRNPALWNLVAALAIVMAVAAVFFYIDQKKDSNPKASASNVSRDTINAEAIDSITTPEAATDLKTTENVSAHSVLTTHASTIREYILVAGSFRSEELATTFLSKLKNESPEFDTEILIVNDTTTQVLYRIVASRNSSFKQLAALRDTLIHAGYTDAWIYRGR